MDTIKKIVRGLASFAFKILILVTVVVAALVLTFHSPKKIEKSLSDSGVYSTFVDSALKEVQKSNTDSSGTGKVPITDPAIQAAAKQAFTPQLLQSSTEDVLNGTYSWLSGKTPTPAFRVDLSSAKQTFAQAVGVAAAQRATSLPVCTLAQLQQITPEQDAFSLPCRPPNFDIAAAQAKVTNDLGTSKDFLGTPVITPQTLPKNSDGKTVFDQLAKAPKIYKWVNASPWLLAALALVSAAIMLALYDSRRRGLRTIAITLLGAGTFLLVMVYLSRTVFIRLSRPSGALGKSLNGSFQQTAIKAASSIDRSILMVVVWLAAAYVVIGGVTLLILHFTKPKAQAPVKPTKSEPKPQAPKPPAPKPRPLIQ